MAENSNDMNNRMVLVPVEKNFATQCRKVRFTQG